MARMPLARRVQYVLHDRLHAGVGQMELALQLPAELVAVADPWARGAAPLLHPGDSDTEPGTGPLPFELYLTLLTAPLPSGETSPPTGKDLPVLPAVAAATAAPAASNVAPLPVDAAVFARLKLASVPAATGTEPAAAPAIPLPNADAPAPALPASTALPTAVGETAAQLPRTHDATPAAPSPAAELVDPESAEAALQALPADTLESASWLERATADTARTARPHGAAADPELAVPMQTRNPFGTPDARLAEPNARLREGQPPLEVMKLTQVSTSAVVEAPKVGADWLPAGHGSGTNAAASSAASVPLPAAAVDLRTPNWQEAFASRVQWLVGSNASEARITLNPPELGAVDVKVSLVDDKTYVQLTTATVAARDELSHSLPRLRELFAASGLELGGASVHDGRGDHRAGHGERAVARELRASAPFVELAEEHTGLAPRRSLGRVDVFA
jgi:flagellar hook-length control protein FliK